MATLLCENDARFLFNVTNRALAVLDSNQLRVTLLLHRLVKLAVNRFNLVILLLPDIFINLFIHLWQLVVHVSELSVVVPLCCILHLHLKPTRVLVFFLKAHFFFLLTIVLVLLHLHHKLVLFIIIFAILAQHVLLRINVANLFFFEQFPLQHLWIKQVRLIFKQVENDMLSVAFEYLALRSIFIFTIWTQAQGLFSQLLLLSPSQEKPLTC